MHGKEVSVTLAMANFKISNPLRYLKGLHNDLPGWPTLPSNTWAKHST
jgi:hypothetical protein